MMDASATGKRGAPDEPSAVQETTRRHVARRVAHSGTAGKTLVAALIVALGLALWPARILEQPAGPKPSPAAGGEAFSAELQAIRSELATRSERERNDAATEAAVAELAARIEAIAREIGPLRSGEPAVPAALPARASASADTGVDAWSERLYNLERRQSQAESDRGKVERQLLARLHDLETRQQHRERDEASALRLLLARVEQLELTRDAAEENRLKGQSALQARLAALESRLESAPAAPHP